MEQGSWEMLGYGYACSVWFCVQMFQWDDDPSYLYATCIWRMGWSCLQPINLWEPWFPGSMLDFAVWNPGHCSSVCLQEILSCCNYGLTVYTTVYVYIHSIIYTYTYTYTYAYTYVYIYILRVICISIASMGRWVILQRRSTVFCRQKMWI